jgi:hypothetical protein
VDDLGFILGWLYETVDDFVTRAPISTLKKRKNQMTIPANNYVTVNPAVIGPSGRALELIGVIMTNSTRVPVGAVASFPNALAVGAYFGLASSEYALATIYFLGFDNSNRKPASLIFFGYNTSPVAAWLRGNSVATMTLAQLQALTGTISLTVGGTTFTSGTITLAGATSPSNAATLILAGFTSPTFSVTYDAVTGAFTFTSTATGATATITAATGSLATSLKLTSGAGAIISQGAAALTPATAIPALVAVTQNWATFTTMVEPSLTDKVAFAAATNALNNRYMYAMWDTDPNAVITGNQTTAGYVIGTYLCRA